MSPEAMAQRIYDGIEFVYLLCGLMVIVAAMMIIAWGTSVVWPFYVWLGAGAVMFTCGLIRVLLRIFCGAEHYS